MPVRIRNGPQQWKTAAAELITAALVPDRD